MYIQLFNFACIYFLNIVLNEGSKKKNTHSIQIQSCSKVLIK